MSVQNAEAFLGMLGKDAQLQAKLRGLKSTAEVVQLGAGAGFSFTVENYDAARKAAMTRMHGAGELSEQELDQVAGGFARKNTGTPAETPYLCDIETPKTICCNLETTKCPGPGAIT